MFEIFIKQQLPAIYVLVHIFTSIFIINARKAEISKVFLILANIITLTISIYGFQNYTGSFDYFFGDWQAPVGISFRYNLYSSASLVFMSLINLLWIIFGFNNLKFIQNILMPTRKNLPYALFSLLHASFAGIILTNDIFNLYVFIEISALSAYGLLSISHDSRSYIGTFEYLLIGTIGATLILIGIGLILASFGSLNLDDISKLFLSKSNIDQAIYNTAKAGCVFVFVGSLIKIAMFPVHWWQIRAYVFTSPVIAANIATYSSYVALSILIKLQFQIFYLFIYKAIFILKYCGIVALLFGSFRALFETNFRKIIVYSSISQVGLYLILYQNFSSESFKLLLCMIIGDSICKFGIFMFISSINIKKYDISIYDLIGFANKNHLKCFIVSVFLVNASGLPISFLFINKISIINMFLVQKEFLLFFSIILYSFISALYFIRIGRQFYKISETENLFLVDKLSFSAVFAVIIIMLLMLISYQNIDFISEEIYMELSGARSI